MLSLRPPACRQAHKVGWSTIQLCSKRGDPGADLLDSLARRLGGKRRQGCKRLPDQTHLRISVSERCFNLALSYLIRQFIDFGEQLALDRGQGLVRQFKHLFDRAILSAPIQERCRGTGVAFGSIEMPVDS